jgi:FMN reductase
MSARIRVLVVGGSAHSDGHLCQCLDVAQQAAEQAGAEVRRLDLDQHPLPIMVANDAGQSQLHEVVHVRKLADWADAMVVGTPEYHGNISGALKNWMDFLYAELAGKVVSVVASTGGGTGDMSITAVRNSMVWCHAFVLPYTAAASNAAFHEDTLSDARVIERLQRVGHDVVRYATALRPAFNAAAAAGRDVENGFAGLHPPRERPDLP